MLDSAERATLVANQLERFMTLPTHRLAGQAANFAFWRDQVRHALAAIDGHGTRFVVMQMAQEQFVVAHDVKIVNPRVGSYHDAPKPPPKAKRHSDTELQKARRLLIQAVKRFANRCKSERLLPDSVVEEFVDWLA
jgi:hypothetical protein